MKKLMLVALLMFGLTFLVSTHAWAVIIDFDMAAPTLGTISYAGGGATPLVGSGISIDTLTDAANPLSPVYALSGATMNFTTGAFTSSTASTWTFAPGGTITVIGGVPGLGIGDGTALLTGSFTNATVTSAGSLFKVAIGGFTDIKDEALARYYGLGPNGLGYGWNGSLNLSFQASGQSPSQFTSTVVLSGDITNEPIIPEPATLGLLGMGILGLLGFRRKV